MSWQTSLPKLWMAILSELEMPSLSLNPRNEAGLQFLTFPIKLLPLNQQTKNWAHIPLLCADWTSKHPASSAWKKDHSHVSHQEELPDG